MNWVLQDHYKVLELNCDASDDEIRSSFIRLALVLPSLFSPFRTNSGSGFFSDGVGICVWLCCRNGIRTNLKKRILLRLGFKKSTRLIKVGISFSLDSWVITCRCRCVWQQFLVKVGFGVVSLELECLKWILFHWPLLYLLLLTFLCKMYRTEEDVTSLGERNLFSFSHCFCNWFLYEL